MGLFDFLRSKPTIPPPAAGSDPVAKETDYVSKQHIFYWSLCLKEFGDPKNLGDWLVLGKAFTQPDGKGGTEYKSEFYGDRDMITVVELESARYWKVAFDKGSALVEETIEHIQSLQNALGVDYILDKERTSSSDEPAVQAAVTVTVAYMFAGLDAYNAGEIIKAAINRRRPRERGGSVYKILRLTNALQRHTTSHVLLPELQRHVVQALRSWPRKDMAGG
jgi:hypothetical protein